MNLPSEFEPGGKDPRQQLGKLRDSLVVLHKKLVDSERVGFEQTFGKIQSQSRFLQLLIDDPWFAWLHPLSELVVAIDELLETDAPLASADVSRIMRQTRELLKASEQGNGFPRSYFDALQREPDVVLAHADVVKGLKGR